MANSYPKNSQILILVVIVGVILFSIYYYKTTKNDTRSSNQAAKVIPSVAPKSESEISYIGIIRSSGLSEDEKKRLGLEFGQYQITDSPTDEKINNTYHGYYLEGKMVTSIWYEGKCVEAKGIVKELSAVDNQFDYYRKVMIPTKIIPLEYNMCKPIKEVIHSNPTNPTEVIKIKGTLTYGVRPAPDIGYDYDLKLPSPIDPTSIYMYDASGTNRKIDSVKLVPKSFEFQEKMDKFVDSAVELTGYMTDGYAESSVLIVTAIK